jgi:hypothetical protein
MMRQFEVSSSRHHLTPADWRGLERATLRAARHSAPQPVRPRSSGFEETQGRVGLGERRVVDFIEGRVAMTIAEHTYDTRPVWRMALWAPQDRANVQRELREILGIMVTIPVSCGRGDTR